MDTAQPYVSDVAFTPSVKAVQSRKGSRDAYKRMEERGSWQTRITPDLARFIEAQTSIFLATANPHLFLIDYTHRERIKIWGEARVIEGNTDLMAKLMPDGYKARPDQVILFTVSAWDAALCDATTAGWARVVALFCLHCATRTLFRINAESRRTQQFGREEASGVAQPTKSVAQQFQVLESQAPYF